MTVRNSFKQSVNFDPLQKVSKQCIWRAQDLMGLLYFRATAEESIFRVEEDLQMVSKRWVKAR